MIGHRRERHAHDLVLQSGVREAHRRFGGFDLPAALAGVLAAFGLTVLVGSATAALEAISHQQGAGQGALWTAGAITAAATLVVALFVGGWVAGRIGRYDGTGNAWLSGLLFVALLGGAAGAGHWADDRWSLLNTVRAPGWVASPGRLAEIVVAVAGILAVLLAAGLGGAVGARYHRRADALIATTQGAAVAHGTNVKPVRDHAATADPDSADPAVEPELSDHDARHAVR